MKLRKSSFTLSVLIGFLSGVLIYQIVQPGFEVLLGVIGLVFLIVIPALRLRSAQAPAGIYGKIGLKGIDSLFRGNDREKRGNDILLLVLLFIIAAALGFGRARFSEHRVTPDQIDFYNGQQMEFEGIVTATDIRRDKAKYTVQLNGPLSFRPKRSGAEKSLSSNLGRDFSTALEMTKGNVLITLAKYPQYQYGDLLRVRGELKAPGIFEDFSYDHYLSRFGIYSVMGYPHVELIAKEEGNWFWSAMAFLQNQFMSRINRLFPEPHGSFMAGLLVGARKGIPPDLMEKFNTTGLSHIIAISGYNITIIIAAVMWALRGLPRRWRFWVAVISVTLFTLFVGASPSVVRAAIMGALGLLALHTGRQNTIHLTVLWAAFFMALWNPKILWWDVGFQLSFLAVLGLVYVAPLFKRFTEKLPLAFGAREVIVMTLSAQIMALPIILYNFDRLSLIAPLSNLLVAFAIPPAMAFGFLAVMVSFIFYPLALLVAYLGWGILSYILKVIDLTAAIPYASVDWEGMQIWMIGGYYTILTIFLLLERKRGIIFSKQKQ